MRPINGLKFFKNKNNSHKQFGVCYVQNETVMKKNTLTHIYNRIFPYDDDDGDGLVFMVASFLLMPFNSIKNRNNGRHSNIEKQKANEMKRNEIVNRKSKVIKYLCEHQQKCTE